MLYGHQVSFIILISSFMFIEFLLPKTLCLPRVKVLLQPWRSSQTCQEHCINKCDIDMRIKYPGKNPRSVIRSYHWHAFEDHGFGVGGLWNYSLRRQPWCWEHMWAEWKAQAESFTSVHDSLCYVVVPTLRLGACLPTWLSICRNKYQKKMQ